jgi:hypothetical protein
VILNIANYFTVNLELLASLPKNKKQEFVARKFFFTILQHHDFFIIKVQNFAKYGIICNDIFLNAK